MSRTAAVVTAASSLTTRIRRITLRVEDPDALAIVDAADSAVGLYADPDGDPGGDDEDGRNYTVRRRHADGGATLIDLDVVLHDHGPGTTWAAGTTPGQRVALDHARSWYRPCLDAAWQLLVADLSGLPAAARIVEELPADGAATLIAEVVEPADLNYLPRRRGVEVLPLIGSGNGHRPSALATAVRAWNPPDGRGYAWFAGEAAESRAVRKHFRAMGWTIDQLDVIGYWRADSETWDARFAVVQDEMVQVYVQALADGKGEKLATEEFDEALERAGL